MTPIRLFCLLIALSVLTPAFADDWLPVTPEELQMKNEPNAPAAPAIYLYRQVDRDDNVPAETVYERIKVLTEEGRQAGNVVISYVKYSETIRNLQARIIHPDGTIADFDGTVYDKPVSSSRSFKVMAKSFSLPGVEVGSIIEYRYRRLLPPMWVFDSRWLLSQNLYTRSAKFSLRPYLGYTLRWTWPHGLPAGTAPPKDEHGSIHLETHDVPAFVIEEYMPPEDIMKYRVDFIYDLRTGREQDPDRFWKIYTISAYYSINKFVGNRRALESAVAQIVQPGDSPEDKARKIYARVQQIRNLSYDRKKSEQEKQREHLAQNTDAADVLKHGYGYGDDINWLFIALLRAAGIEADPVAVSGRDTYFFDPRHMNTGEINSELVVAKVGDRDMFFDPGAAFTPFGMLAWPETSVIARRLNATGGAWIATPLPGPAESCIDRKVSLHLTLSGSLEGKATVTYRGGEALWRRVSERIEDDTERRKFIEDDLKNDVPTGIEISLTNSPDWSGSEALVAEYDVKVPGWATPAGKRMLLSVGLFGADEKHTFEHNARVQPLYFDFPYQHTDDVTIELPPGWEASSLPKARTSDLKLASYSMTVENDKGTLHLKRDLMLNLTLVDVKFYQTLREFFQTVRAGDEDQIVVSRTADSVQH